MSRKRGFTLIEVLVVTAILGIAISVIAACLAGGVRAWDAARSFNRLEAEALAGMTAIEKDLRNTFEFYAAPFSVEPSAMSFPGLAPLEESTLSRIGTIRYTWDPKGRRLLRVAWPFPGPEGLGTGREALISNLDALSLEYGSSGSSRDQTLWISETTNLPNAVRLRLWLSDTRDTVTLERTIVIKAGRGE